MSMTEAHGVLAKATKDLMTTWQNTKMVWTDEQARRFENDILDVLQKDVRQAGEGMDSLGQILSQARRECGE
jgi:hypothetical protein